MRKLLSTFCGLQTCWIAYKQQAFHRPYVYLFTDLLITEYVNITAYDDDAGTLVSAVNCKSTANADV